MKNDFSKGSIKKNILIQAFPLMLAQLVHLLYNVTDRIYIGHLPENSSLALTGVGLAFPLTTLIAAFTFLYGSGGTPLFSIARGKGDDAQAEKILGQVVTLLLSTSVILFVLCYVFRKPVLYLFGASDASYAFADEYLKIYLFGTLFSMMTTGLNSFINAQGYPQIGMGSVMIGAVINIILDPILIFGLHMGVAGAAVATVISQFCSFVWLTAFFLGKKNLYRIRRENLALEWPVVKEILSLGVSGFVMKGTNAAFQIVCNVTLRAFGGDLFVGIMTVINSIREIIELPASCVTTGAQPVLGFNYGARQYDRVKEGIRFMAVVGTLYLMAVWAVVLIFPNVFFSIFTSDTALLAEGRKALQIYFLGFFFMAGQNTGQAAFTALKCPKRAVFFSLFRKVVIVIPLTLLLPRLGMGVKGVFLAEPISNLVGGMACVTTMYLTLYRKLGKEVL